MGRLSGKVALITGGTTGIGLATALRFAREGARVAIVSNEPDAGAAAVAAADAAFGPGVVRYLPGDVARAEDCARVVREAVEAFGSLQIVFANAAVGTRTVGGTVESIGEELWELAYRTNLAGVAEICRAAVPHLRAAGGGAVLLTSSSSALIGTLVRPSHAYAAMKGALLALARAMAVSYGPDRIRVNAIVPGMIRTRLTADVLSDPAMAERALATVPLGFPGEPDDIAYAALYLASDEARFVTGAALVVDGGATIA